MRIVIISSILPATNYSAYLIDALQKKYPKKTDILVYASRDKANLKVPLKSISLVWSKNILYPLQILKQALKDKPKIVHLQHEINMFGGLLTAAIFPGHLLWGNFSFPHHPLAYSFIYRLLNNFNLESFNGF